jgi:lysophospholipase L1-like esterase
MRLHRPVAAILAAGLVLLAVRAAAVPPVFLIHDGDTVMFVGDSVTEHGAYLDDIAMYFAVRWPEWRVELLDRGRFGERAVDGLQRLQRDVIALKPQMAVLFFGVNDGRYQAFNPEFFAAFVNAERQMVSRLKAAGIAVALATPTVIDPDQLHGYHGDAAEYIEVLGRYAQAVMDIGRELAVPVLDVYGALRAAQQQAKATLPNFTMFPAGVHPSAAGHLVIAARMLRDLGALPMISDLTIDAATATVVSAAGCSVRELQTRDGALSFVRADAQGWWYIDPETRAIVPHAPDVRALDAVWLRVRELAAGSYRVRVDGQSIEEEFSAAQLAQGLYVPSAAPPLWPPRLAELAQRIAARQQMLRLQWDPLQASLPDGPERTAILAQMTQLNTRLRSELATLTPPQPARWEIIPQRREH